MKEGVAILDEAQVLGRYSPMPGRGQCAERKNATALISRTTIKILIQRLSQKLNFINPKSNPHYFRILCGH